MQGFAMGELVDLLREFFAFALTLTSMVLCYRSRSNGGPPLKGGER